MTSAASSACPSGGDGQARSERGDARGSALRYLLSNVVVRRRVRGYQSYSVVDALDSLRLNCFEFTSADSAKKSEVDEQLDLLQRPAPPKIANGLFVVKDGRVAVRQLRASGSASRCGRSLRPGGVRLVDRSTVSQWGFSF
ncbi:hypothetical protein EEB13_07920 [Rhodococcus sp. WS3]|nr:hypothetical protein EEB13_07920 [Rhodococcus sp. WS3]